MEEVFLTFQSSWRRSRRLRLETGSGRRRWMFVRRPCRAPPPRWWSRRRTNESPRGGRTLCTARPPSRWSRQPRVLHSSLGCLARLSFQLEIRPRRAETVTKISDPKLPDMKVYLRDTQLQWSKIGIVWEYFKSVSIGQQLTLQTCTMLVLQCSCLSGVMPLQLMWLAIQLLS